MAPRSRQRSSAPLQVLLFLNGWYSATYFLLEAFVFVYKGEPPIPAPSLPGTPRGAAPCPEDGLWVQALRAATAVPAVLLLPYPFTNLVLDVVLLFLYLSTEATRIFFGSKGNLCQRKVPLSISLALTVPAAVMATYYLLLQTYALRLEAILSAILLLFYAVELLLGVLLLVSFSRYRCRAGSWVTPGCQRSELPSRFGADTSPIFLLGSVDSY
ncbi:transmembrane protein 216 isoform 1-T1 [Alca torda]